MFKNITIGQYYPADSVIHRLDPRMKLVAIIAAIVALFLIRDFYGYGLFTLFLAVTIYFSQVPPMMIIKGLKAMVFLILFTVTLNVFFSPGERVIFEYGIIHITAEGLETAGMMALRLILLVCVSSVLTLSTSPIELTDAIEFLLRPLKVIKVPAHEIAMMMTIALRFIPTLLEEMEKIMKAQSARGADFDTGGLVKKAKSLVPILVPLFISSFRRADELAIAMESRCYRGDVNRTRMKVMRLEQRDYIAIAITAIFLICMLIV